MKLAFFFVCFLSISAQLNSQTAANTNIITDTTTTFSAFWKKGETRVVNIKKSRVSNRNGVRQEGSSTYQGLIKVLKKTANGYTLQWTYKNIQSSRKDNPLVNSMNAMMEGVKVIYTTDEYGSFTDLVNWEEMRDYMQALLEKAIKESPDYNPNNTEMNAIFAQMKQLFQSKESIQNTFIREIQLLHTPYGMEYKLHEKLNIEAQIPNIFGGDPFPANIEIELTELKPKENFCKLSMIQTMNPDETRRIMHESFLILSKNSGKPVPSIEELPKFDIIDTNEYEFNLKSSWVTKVNYKREMTHNEGSQVDAYELELEK